MSGGRVKGRLKRRRVQRKRQADEATGNEQSGRAELLPDQQKAAVEVARKYGLRRAARIYRVTRGQLRRWLDIANGYAEKPGG